MDLRRNYTGMQKIAGEEVDKYVKKQMYIVENDAVILTEGEMIQPLVTDIVKYSYTKPNNSWQPIWSQAYSKFFRDDTAVPEIEIDESNACIISIGIFNLLDKFRSFYPAL